MMGGGQIILPGFGAVVGAMSGFMLRLESVVNTKESKTESESDFESD